MPMRKVLGRQYALNPNNMEYCVIEMNARLSRSRYAAKSSK